MVCRHLAELERALIDAGVEVTYRGQAWSSNCREWVYFKCWLDRAAVRARMKFDDCVTDHEHCGTHDGQEAGFVCSQCHDGIMGVHERYRAGMPTFA
jgi:hypothetical protein